jgi:hypothetical protein
MRLTVSISWVPVRQKLKKSIRVQIPPVGHKARKILPATAKQTKVRGSSIEIRAEFCPDNDRMLQGLMLLCGIDKSEIEARLRVRRVTQAQEPTN